MIRCCGSEFILSKFSFSISIVFLGIIRRGAAILESAKMQKASAVRARGAYAKNSQPPSEAVGSP